MFAMRRERITSMPRSSLALLIAAALAGCDGARNAESPVPATEPVPTASADAPLEIVQYRCGDLKLEARFFEHSVTLLLDEVEISLSEVVAASGARYASGADPAEIEFWSKGREAMFSMRGTRHPTCVAEGGAPAAERYRAVGQEPFWTLIVEGEGGRYVTPYGEMEVTAVSRIEAEGGRIISGQSERGELRMIVESGRLCRDSMSGMPHPDSVRLTLGEDTHDGCGGEPLSLLVGRQWRIVEIDGSATLPGTEPTLTFLGGGQVAGHGGCNRFSGGYALSGEGVGLGPIAATKMACLQEGVMAQESRLLDLLAATARFDFDEARRLLLIAADERRLVAVPADL
jgi:heat shock protein HslJ/membrane-bound inhibitor of C-type lysozyme